MKSKFKTIEVCPPTHYSRGGYLANDSEDQTEKVQDILLKEIFKHGAGPLTRFVVVTPDPSLVSYLRSALESGGIISHDFYPEENYYSKLTQHEWSHEYYEFTKLIRLFEMIVDNDGVIDNALSA